jgi:hypothetical protein
VQRGEVWWADLSAPDGSGPGYWRPVLSVTVSAVLLVDGHVAGTWSGEAQRGRFEVRVTPFEPFSRATRTALDAEDVGRFSGLPATLVPFGGR